MLIIFKLLQFSYIRKIGGLVIIDEVQTGLGRLGDYTWGFERHGIVPDIMTTGKPLGNGHPLAVTVSSEKIADSLGIIKDLVKTKPGQKLIIMKLIKSIFECQMFCSMSLP